MPALPPAVDEYLQTLPVQLQSPAYLLVHKDGCVGARGGHLATYGMSDLCEGLPLEQQLDFFVGLFPLDDVPLFLPCLEITPNLFVDVHVLPHGEGAWIVFLDVTDKAMVWRQAQQQMYDTHLQHERLARLSSHS